MKKIIFFIIVILVAIGCEKQKSDEYSYSLIGEWSWISSCGGISYHCITPESSNHNVKITFTADSLFSTYQDGVLIQSTKFQTYISPTSDMPGTPDIIKYGPSLQLYFSIHHDTLTLNSSYVDGFLSLYKRIK
jgi:hypothetical protein